ncbi:MAG: ABC transporter ATP-binding protein [Planctomycetaceae bacterium]|nr:ABC transporter ATP-binding protein [Planctomycetales bacterium]MCB9921923.1 ABC transporter ATP-binding protein [Planctomycetaceae bacterium]
MTNPLIEVKNLRTHFFTDEGTVKAVDDVSFTIPKGKTLGLVGESGSGKSVTAFSLIRLISSPGRIVEGSVKLHNEDGSVELTKLAESEMRKLRGNTIAMIFQEPMTSLNPVFTVGSQIMEAIRLHQKVDKAEARNRAIEMLQKVKVPAPEQRIKEYPHQFSGGMRQRVMIAMALSCNPKLLIADEPTTALDVTIQAQILDLLRELQEENDMSILLITHDLGIIAEVAAEVAVMYASKIVEHAPVAELFNNPRHPYTHGLFASKLTPETKRGERLVSIDGMVPSPLRFPAGCKFHPRCPFQQERCEQEEPSLREFTPGHIARCHFVEEIDYGGEC